MVKVIDRRGQPKPPEPNPDPPGVERHADGSVRRIAPGVRTASDFFSPEQQGREVTRGELINVLSMVLYEEEESRWVRRLIRWLRRRPQVLGIGHRMRRAHAEMLEDIRRKMQEQDALERQRFLEGQLRNAKKEGP